MFDLLHDSLTAIGSYTEPKPGAVGFGSVAVPNSRDRISQLIDFVRDGCAVDTPLGRLTISNAIPTPGTAPRMLITGSIADGSPRGAPITYSPLVPQNLTDFAQGRYSQFGNVEIAGLMKLPTLSYDGSQDSVLIAFEEPLHVRKAIDPAANRVRRWTEKHLQADLQGIRITRTQGFPILTVFAHWIAPTLTWN